MAGTYPDVPAPRMPYDRDGTIGFSFLTNLTSIVTLTNADLISMNDENIATSGSLSGSSSRWVCLIFPELRDIVALTITNASSGSNGINNVEVSSNSTNGIDGTWTSLTTNFSDAAATGPAYRTDFRSHVATGIKAIRALNSVSGAALNCRVGTFHIYGTKSAVSDRLEFWHPTLDQSLDWGDVARSTTTTRTVRLKNLSGSLTAGTITVGMEALYDASPSMISQHTFDYNGGGFGATATIPSLGPGQVSGIITIQQNISSTAALSVWEQRVYANASTWA
jgi:hypothetical protein